MTMQTPDPSPQETPPANPFPLARCSSCQALIIWAVTEPKDGKPSRNMPIDADPENLGYPLQVADGNLLIARTVAGKPVVRYVPKAIGRHVSHFASCDNPKKFRRPR